MLLHGDTAQAPQQSAQRSASSPAAHPAPTARSPVRQCRGADASAVAITLEQAIELAKKNNPTLPRQPDADSQNKAQEITANLRPNPLLSWDTQYLPIFQPSLFASNYIGRLRRNSISVLDIFLSAARNGNIGCRRLKSHRL